MQLSALKVVRNMVVYSSIAKRVLNDHSLACTNATKFGASAIVV